MDHPCAQGLTKACFAAYPEWAKQALAYRLLHVLLPHQLTRRLPTLPLPPGFTIPAHWRPWFWFIFNTNDPLWAIFPPGWMPSDPLPPGIELPPGYVLPYGWTPSDPPPPFFIPGYQPQPQDPATGQVEPLFVNPWEPGPPHRPTGGMGSKQIDIYCDGWEMLTNVGENWDTVRNTTAGAGFAILGPGYPESYITDAQYFWASYMINRVIFRFPLTDLPAGAKITSAFITLFVTDTTNAYACLQRCPAAVFGSENDYISYTGAVIGQQQMSPGKRKFIIGTGGLTYLQSSNPDPAYFIAREYAHDYNNDSPLNAEDFRTDCATQYNTDIAKRPVLNITYRG